MLAAHDAVTINSWKNQHKLGKLVHQGRQAAHTASLDQLPETERPPGPDDPLGGREIKPLAKARYRSLQGAAATVCLRTRPTDSLQVMSATKFVGSERRFMGIDERVVVRFPGCDATDVDTRHARIRPRAGAQVNQHQPLLHAISRALKRLGVPHQVENGEPFLADRNLRVDNVVRRGSFWNAPNPEYRDKSILVDVTHAAPQAQVPLRAGSADNDGSAASTSEACKRQHYTRPGHVSFDERSHKLTTFAVESFWASG